MFTSHAVLIVLSALVVLLFGWQEYLAHRLRDQRGLLWRAQAILQHCSVEYGYCCCGEEMKTHDNGMHSGHAPVDQGTCSAARWQTDFLHSVGLSKADSAYLNRR